MGDETLPAGGCNYIPLAGGEPPRAKGELTFGKRAIAITFCLRADACGYWILQIHRFFVLPDGTREDPQAGPSLDFPGPKGEGGAPPPPLDSSSTPSGTTSCMILKRCSMGAKRVS